MDVKYGLCVSLMSMVFFTFVKIVVVYIGAPKSVTKDIEKWNNICVSCIHACVCSMGVVCSFVLYPEEFQDLTLEGNTLIYLTVCMSVGYFTYDTFDMLLQRHKLKTSLFEIISHHAGVMALLYHNIILKICMPYTIVGLVAEVNSVFLHLRKILQMAKLNSVAQYEVVAVVNIFTFVVFRGGVVVWTTYAVLFDFYGRIPLVSHAMVCVWTLTIDVVNYRFFCRIVKNDYFKKRLTIKSDSANGVSNGVNLLKVE